MLFQLVALLQALLVRIVLFIGLSFLVCSCLTLFTAFGHKCLEFLIQIIVVAIVCTLRPVLVPLLLAALGFRVILDLLSLLDIAQLGLILFTRLLPLFVSALALLETIFLVHARVFGLSR